MLPPHLSKPTTPKSNPHLLLFSFHRIPHLLFFLFSPIPQDQATAKVTTKGNWTVKPWTWGGTLHADKRVETPSWAFLAPMVAVNVAMAVGFLSPPPPPPPPQVPTESGKSRQGPAAEMRLATRGHSHDRHLGRDNTLQPRNTKNFYTGQSVWSSDVNETCKWSFQHSNLSICFNKNI